MAVVALQQSVLAAVLIVVVVSLQVVVALLLLLGCFEALQQSGLAVAFVLLVEQVDSLLLHLAAVLLVHLGLSAVSRLFEPAVAFVLPGLSALQQVDLAAASLEVPGLAAAFATFLGLVAA